MLRSSAGSAPMRAWSPTVPRCGRCLSSISGSTYPKSNSFVFPRLWNGSELAAGVLGLEPLAGLEDPGHERQRYRHEHQGHREADRDAHVGDAVEAPAEAADEVDDGVEQGNRLPEWRQHVDRIEAAAEECQRGDDEQRHELQLFESIGPDADDEADEAEGHRRKRQEQDHP